MYTYSIIITRNGQEIKKFLDFLPVLSIYFSIECQLLLEVKISAVDALYRLLGTLTITPVEDRFLPRLASVFLLYTKRQVRLKDIPRLLRKTKCTPTEREVLALAGKASLSTAELLLSMERGVLIRKEEDILEKLYTSPEDTCSTLTD